MGPDGFPLSWRHYLYGLHALGLALMRSQLSTAEATRLANAPSEEYTAWRSDVTRCLTPLEPDDPRNG